MKTVTLGNSDMEITRIGFGAWAIGGAWEWGWGNQADKTSLATLHTALDAGLNWIDTAAIYGLGHSEKVVGQLLKERNQQPYIFTKCSLVWDEANTISNSMKADSLRREVEQSLTRLGIEVIDLYQIHWPNPDEEIEEGWETLAALQKEGKVRYIGVSNFSVSQMERAGGIAPITSNQPPYSLISRDIEAEILPYCAEHKIGTIVYSPMASGLLSGKMTQERVANLAKDDWRSKNEQFQEPRLTRNLQLAELLKTIGEQHNATAGEIAIAWTLLNPAVTAAIVGLRHPDQVAGVINADNVELTAENVQAITDFLQTNP